MTMSSTSTTVLLELLKKNIEVLEKVCAASGTHIPDLHSPYNPSTEAFRNNPDAAEASNVIVAAAHQLAATLTPPHVSLYSNSVGGIFKATAMRICIESHVTEILREAGPQGLHVDEISKINGQDPQKLARFLRLLSLHHIYREISPDVFANTRISSVIDTLKPTKELLNNPEKKHDNTTGLTALASHHLDEGFKAAAYSWETCLDPSTAYSGEPEASPFARVFNKRIWDFYEQPDQKFRQKRFGIGMRGVLSMQIPDAAMHAFDWKSLPTGSLVVDVGGGIGSVTHTILKHCPDLKFIVQDLPGPVDDGKKWWATHMPQAIESGQVKFEVHDFLLPQSHKSAKIFMVKQILHDWSDQYCVKILKHLRDAATPETILVVLDSVMPYACHDPSAEDKNAIPGAAPKEAPEPLLANYGAANEMGYLPDIGMFIFCNSQERTIGHFDRLLRGTGWKLTAVNRQPGGDSTFIQALEATPL